MFEPKRPQSCQPPPSRRKWLSRPSAVRTTTSKPLPPERTDRASASTVDDAEAPVVSPEQLADCGSEDALRLAACDLPHTPEVAPGPLWDHSRSRAESLKVGDERPRH